MVDPQNPYRYVEVRGDIFEITEEGANEHIDFLANRYLGVEKYPSAGPSEVRVLYRIKPTRVTGMG